MTDPDFYDFIRRRCYVCGCCLRFFPLRPPEWFIGLKCLGCGYENVAYDTPLSLNEAQSLAQYLSIESQSPEAQEEAQHWEVSAARLRKKEARSFRERFLRRFPQYKECLRVPTPDAPELLHIPSEHPKHTDPLTVTQHAQNTTLAWGNVGWHYHKHPQTLPDIITILTEILSEQLLIRRVYRQGVPYSINYVRPGERLRLPRWEASLGEVHLSSWRGTYDYVLEHSKASEDNTTTL